MKHCHYRALTLLRTVWLGTTAIICLQGVSSGIAQAPTPAPSPSPTATPPFATGFVPATAQQLQAFGVSEAPFSGVALPPSFDLTNDFPKADNVGQGSMYACVGWALSYALRSYDEREHQGGWPYYDSNGTRLNERVFSPLFLWNLVNNGINQGVTIASAADKLQYVGDVSMARYPWSDSPGAPSEQPSAEILQEAAAYRITTIKLLDPKNIAAIKGYLAARKAIVVGMYLDNNFYSLRGDTTWESSVNYNARLDVGHAVALVGYDDSRVFPSGGSGAFKFVNSWGTDDRKWGSGGYGWISYDAFQHRVAEVWLAQPSTTPLGANGLAGNELAKNVAFQLDPFNNIKDISFSPGIDYYLTLHGTITAPAGAVGVLTVVIRLYHDLGKGRLGSPVPGAVFQQFTTPDGWVAGMSDAMQIPTPGYFKYPWSAAISTTAIGVVHHSRPEDRTKYDFLAVPELYIDGIQLAKGDPIPVSLYL
jgi:hypothetical protein